MSPFHFLKLYLNIILPSTLGPSKWFLSFRFPHQNPVYNSPLPQTCYVLHPPHSSRYDHQNNICWAVQIITFLFIYSLSLVYQTTSCSSSNVSSVAFSWFSPLHLNLHARILKPSGPWPCYRCVASWVLLQHSCSATCLESPLANFSFLYISKTVEFPSLLLRI